jgi:hypothetical protein
LALSALYDATANVGFSTVFEVGDDMTKMIRCLAPPRDGRALFATEICLAYPGMLRE